MPTHPRNAIYREGEIGIYHCWSRCVQRAHLCGQDTYTGMDFHYRRPIIEALLKYQAGIFGVDLANYNVLSNHMHLVVRTRPDVVDTWDDERVAKRWKLAWPKWDGHRWMREPTEEEIQELLVDKKKLATARRGLSSLSWFLARCKEPLARHFNQEMQTLGHFWEARFGSREIMDEAALLACMIYVDTNQIKAGMAKSLEESECSAIAARLKAAREREAIASLEEFHKSRDAGFELSAEQIEALFADAFLSPISANGPLMTETVLQALAGSEATTMLTRKDDQTADGAEPNDEDKLPPSGSGIVAEKATGETPLDAINRS
ncbi:MAG: transposase, partial [Planctomycetes bacterium]|nr:transposase [Planctomycetota bacterium]